jgi:hypothetical protein
MGIAYITGDMGKTLERPEGQGGYDCYRVLSQFGYQFEVQYMSAGNFLALVEVLGMVSGMEQQLFIPSIILMNGFRLNKQGLEFAFGPTIALRKSCDGFYDTDGLMGGELDHWYRDFEWDGINPGITNPYDVVNRMDSRGEVGINTSWVWAIGKTFRSGYLNIPVNLYTVPRKEGWYIGLSVGFNTSRKRGR